MANTYELLQSSSSINQGAYGQPIYMKRIRAAVITPVDYGITPVQFANLKAKLQADAISEDPFTRIQVIGTFAGYEAANTDATTLTSGYGINYQPYQGQYGGTFQFADMDLARHQRRQSLNGRASEFRIILFDEDMSAIGTRGENDLFQGFTPAELRANDVAMDAGQGVFQTMYISWADSVEFNRGNLLILGTKVNVNSAIKLVADVTVRAETPIASRVVPLSFIIEGTNLGTNLAERYAAIFAANPALISAINYNTGATVATVSAAPGVLAGVHVMTATFSPTNFPTSGQYLQITLDGPTAAGAVGMQYFESPLPLVLLIP